jgi:hypothetical protein
MGEVKRKSELVRRHRWLRFAATLAGVVLLATLPAFSQNCALCYTQAASSGASVIAALKSGILILIVPPTLGSVAMIFLVHRKSYQVRRPENDEEIREEW